MTNIITLKMYCTDCGYTPHGRIQNNSIVYHVEGEMKCPHCNNPLFPRLQVEKKGEDN